MTGPELEIFAQDWARQAAQHAATGNALRLQQNENYWRRMMLAHVADPQQRQALAILRRSLFVDAIGEEEVA